RRRRRLRGSGDGAAVGHPRTRSGPSPRRRTRTRTRTSSSGRGAGAAPRAARADSAAATRPPRRRTSSGSPFLALDRTRPRRAGGTAWWAGTGAWRSRSTAAPPSRRRRRGGRCTSSGARGSETGSSRSAWRTTACAWVSQKIPAAGNTRGRGRRCAGDCTTPQSVASHPGGCSWTPARCTLAHRTRRRATARHRRGPGLPGPSGLPPTSSAGRSGTASACRGASTARPSRRRSPRPPPRPPPAAGGARAAAAALRRTRGGGAAWRAARRAGRRGARPGRRGRRRAPQARALALVDVGVESRVHRHRGGSPGAQGCRVASRVKTDGSFTRPPVLDHRASLYGNRVESFVGEERTTSCHGCTTVATSLVSTASTSMGSSCTASCGRSTGTGVAPRTRVRHLGDVCWPRKSRTKSNMFRLRVLQHKTNLKSAHQDYSLGRRRRGSGCARLQFPLKRRGRAVR
ncbi:unnamed protein product, partial [Prorocentrum cordatum]